MSKTRAGAYAERFNRVFDYIDQHLNDDLSVECLSRVANFSKFHFHRQFSVYAGINVSRYIQLMRLKRASYRLVFGSEALIADIALEAGFENPESFSRAFKQIFGQSPSQFRQNPEWIAWSDQYSVLKRQENKVIDLKIVEFSEAHIAALEHRSDPRLLNEYVQRFIEWHQENAALLHPSNRIFGLISSNVNAEEVDRFDFDLCAEVIAPVPENAQGIINKIIPGGRCAVVRHIGAHERLGDSLYPVFREWLPQSGEELREFPMVAHYLNFMPAVAEHELMTDIYILLR